MRTLHSVVEILETRISPAVFFVSSISLAVTDSTGANAMDTITETQAAAKTGADFAISLATGDKLVLDANSNLKLDAGDTILAQVTTGQALAFLNHNSSPDDGRFTIHEFDGLVVSDGFSGKMRANQASVVTALLPDGSLATDASNDLVIQNASIAGLTVIGNLYNIGAGSSISNLTIKPAPGEGTDQAGANGIFTGTAASGQFFVDASSAVFTPLNGATGGSISNVSVARGVTEIRAGDGGNGPTGGAGGAITNVTLGAAFFGLTINGGHGGNGTGGTGGAGGAISALKVTGIADNSGVEILGGDGGLGSAGNAGGAGGDVSKVVVKIGAIVDNLTISGGAGGNGSTAGAGGVGGALAGVVANIGIAQGTTTISGGDGGDGGSSGLGGAGGALSLVNFTSTGSLVGKVNITGGQGGGSTIATAGAGGAFSDVKARIAHADGDVNLLGGFGGDAANAGGTGGAGGALTRVNVNVTASVIGNLEIDGGAGGQGTAGADAGAGGMLSFAKVNAASLGSLGVFGGRGGNTATDGDGGAGGALSDASAKIGFSSGNNSFDIASGRGGTASGGASTGNGGNGGSVSRARVSVLGGIIDVAEIFSGRGGISHGGRAGDGGDITDAKVIIGAAAVADYAEILPGGGENSTTGSGGNGGSLERVTIINSGRTANVDLSVGSGGDNSSGTGNGGVGGNARHLLIVNLGLADLLQASAGSGGDAGGSGAAGKGGDLQAVTIKNAGGLEFESEIDVVSSRGGNAGIGGSPGNGGNLGQVSVIDPEGIAFVVISSGFGGDAKNVTGGTGGAVDGVQFTAPHSNVEVQSGRGGASQVTGGHGGILRNISGSADILLVGSGRGGTATTAAGGHGGDGGLIEKVNVAVHRYAQGIIAGSGGNGANSGGGVGGIGGDIKNVKITGRGDIGNFVNPFGGSTDEMGGLIAGIGGTGVTHGLAGSIDGVVAKRIAAIYAGTTNTNADSLTNDNAVTAIAHITAKVIGADQDGDGLFDFIDAGAAGFGLGQGDTAIDGLVIVKAGGFDDPTINATPLFKIEV